MVCSFKCINCICAYEYVCNTLFYVQQRKQTLSMSLGKLKGVFRLTDESDIDIIMNIGPEKDSNLVFR